MLYIMICIRVCECVHQEHSSNRSRLNESRTSFVFPKSPPRIYGVFSISLRERWLTLIRKWQIVTKDNALRSSGRLQGTLMRLYCADRHLSVESRSFSPVPPLLPPQPPPPPSLFNVACLCPLLFPVFPARSFCGRLASARALLAGWILLVPALVLLFVPLQLGLKVSSLFSNNTKGPVPSGYLCIILYAFGLLCLPSPSVLSPSISVVGVGVWDE